MRYDTSEALDQISKVLHGFGKRDFIRSPIMLAERGSPLCRKGAGGPHQSDPRAVRSLDKTIPRLAAVRVTLRLIELSDRCIAPTVRPRFLNQREPIEPVAM